METPYEDYFDFSPYVTVCATNGDQITALCPFHKDRHPSFSANAKTGAWKCFAGCGHGNFISFFHRWQAISKKQAQLDPELRDLLRTSVSKRFEWTGYLNVATYYYENDLGQTVFRVKRLEHPNKGKTFIQEHWNGLKWHPGKYTGLLQPYRFKQWSRSDSTPLFFVEGEKCANDLASSKLRATTVPGGVSGWVPDYCRYFAHERVILIPDNDAPGKNFMTSVAKSLSTNGIENTILHLPNLEHGEDIFDWFRKGNTLNALLDLVRTK